MALPKKNLEPMRIGSSDNDIVVEVVLDVLNAVLLEVPVQAVRYSVENFQH